VLFTGVYVLSRAGFAAGVGVMLAAIAIMGVVTWDGGSGPSSSACRRSRTCPCMTTGSSKWTRGVDPMMMQGFEWRRRRRCSRR
jgi:hypothetical protein